jgi:hypothetical protein
MNGFSLGTELEALVDGRQEAAAPGAVAGSKDLARDEGNKGRTILIFAAEAVAEPGADAGPSEARETGEGEELRGGVIELLGVEGFDEAELIGHSLEVGEKVGKFDAGVPTFFEGVFVVLGSAEEVGLFADEGELFAFKKFVGAELSAAFLEFGFEIEEVEVGGGSDHVDVDDALRFGGVMKAEFGERIRAVGKAILLQHGGKGGAAEAEAGLLEKETTSGVKGRGHEGLTVWSSFRRD